MLRAGTEGIEDGDEIVDIDDAIAAGRGDICITGSRRGRAGAETVEDGYEVVDVDDAIASGRSDVTRAGRRGDAVCVGSRGRILGERVEWIKGTNIPDIGIGTTPDMAGNEGAIGTDI